MQPLAFDPRSPHTALRESFSRPLLHNVLVCLNKAFRDADRETVANDYPAELAQYIQPRVRRTKVEHYLKAHLERYPTVKAVWEQNAAHNFAYLKIVGDKMVLTLLQSDDAESQVRPSIYRQNVLVQLSLFGDEPLPAPDVHYGVVLYGPAQDKLHRVQSRLGFAKIVFPSGGLHTFSAPPFDLLKEFPTVREQIMAGIENIPEMADVELRPIDDSEGERA